MNKLRSIWPSLITFLITIVFGCPVLYAVLHHPASRMASEAPLYKELSKNSFMVMSSKTDLATGRLVRYTDTVGKEQITRIVGIPGDEVRFAAGMLYVNGATVGEYPNISLPNSTLIVPRNGVFCFPDYIPTGSASVEYSSWDTFVVPDSAINATILYTFNNTTSAEEHPELFVYGAALMILYGLLFFSAGKRKGLIYPPLYYLARIAIGLNLVIWSIIGLYGIYTGLWAVLPAIFYTFISWLTFLGLSISDASISLLLIIVIGVLAVFSDVAITVKDTKIKH